MSGGNRRMIKRARQALEAAATRPALEPAGDGNTWLDRRFQPQFRQAGLAGFEDFMATVNGRCLRELKIRENWYLPAPDALPACAGLYLKKHRVRTWSSLLRAVLGIGPGETAARAEVQNVECLTSHGIEVMRVVAYGEKLHRNGLLESFLLTEELEGYTDLRCFLLCRFGSRQSQPGAARDRDLERLIRQVADVARRFHEAGYNHRDFYCCHFFVKQSAPGDFDIRLIDLQRVQRRRRFRRRWLIKDLAQLAWSAPRSRVKCTQRLAFIRHYLGVRKLAAADKALIRKVLWKQKFMEWRLGTEP
jgi:heptose I phosphotransferase